MCGLAETHSGCAMQTDINENMRAILIDWLVEVHYKFKVRAPVMSLRSCTSPDFPCIAVYLFSCVCCIEESIVRFHGRV